MTEYSILSKELTNQIPKNIKKDEGIYFTPPSVVNHNIELITKLFDNCTISSLSILEPSCGSGEYIEVLKKKFSLNTEITGIEKNVTIYQSIKPIFCKENVKLINTDYLNFDTKTKYDLIIGNPPFYVMKKELVNKKYWDFFDGRPNIFVLFLIKSFELLKDNGILSFILPKNFLNCLYYDKTRKYLITNCEILHIVDGMTGKFIDTQQETVIFIIQKSKSIIDYKSVISPYVLNINEYTIFATKSNLEKYRHLCENSTTLSALGFRVSVGTVVWNQCKDILTDDETQTRLIYSSDVETGIFIPKKYKNKEKLNYIRREGINKPLIVVNRGYGVGNYKFYACLVEMKTEEKYLVENHLICIEYIETTDENNNVLLNNKYKKILDSFNDKRTIDFINIYFGNNAINTTELLYILPIYQDI